MYYNSQLNSLNLSPNFIGDFNDETNFLHKLFLTDTQVSKFHKNGTVKRIFR